jgi:acetyl-CoA synthetase (ADP-forming)
VSSPPGTTSTITLSEAASKALLAPYGVPVPDERVVAGAAAAAAAATEIGFPVVAKLCGDRIAHKTERGLVRLALGDAAAVEAAAADLLAAATPDDGDVGVLVAPMVSGNRELIAGMSRDPQFGPTVMIGVGGILAEAVADVAIALVPVEAVDAEDLIDSLATQELLGAFRGEPAVDRAAIVEVVTALSRLAVEHDEVVSVDLNPLIIVDGRPVAVDALVEVAA